MKEEIELELKQIQAYFSQQEKFMKGLENLLKILNVKTEDKVIPLSEKRNSKNINSYHYAECDVKEAVNNCWKEVWKNIDEIADGKHMTFDYDLVKDIFEKHFGEEMIEK